MARIGDRLQRSEQAGFVGRALELETIDRFLADPDGFILSITGIGGIGKSSLLASAMRRSADTGWTVIATDMNITSAAFEWLDNAGRQWASGIEGPSRYIQCAEQLQRVTDAVASAIRECETDGETKTRDQIAAAASQVLGRDDLDLYLNGRTRLTAAFAEDTSTATPSHRVLIAIDTFEKATPGFEAWLQEELLPELDDSARIVIAGQRPLVTGWDNWRGLIRTIELTNFTEDELGQLIARSQLRPSIDSTALMTATGGYPLAASLVLSTVGSEAGTSGAIDLDESVYREPSIGRMFRAIPSFNLQFLVQTVAGFPVITLDVLRVAADTYVSSEQWADFCALPFVRRSSGGAQVHDIVHRYLISAAYEDYPAEFAQRHGRVAIYWREQGEVPLYLYHLCVAEPGAAFRAIRNTVLAAHSTGNVRLVESITSQLLLSQLTFPHLAIIAQLVEAYLETLEGDWDQAHARLELLDASGLPKGDRGLLSVELDRFRCEVARYLGDLVMATGLAEAGLTSLKRQARESADSKASALLGAELLAQLVELNGLRGRVAHANRAALELTSSDHVGESDPQVARLRLFHREHLARWQGRWANGLETLLEAESLIAPDDDYTASRLLYGVGRVFTYMGWFTAATELLVASAQGFRTSHRRQQLGESLVGLAIIDRELGLPGEAIAKLEEARSIFQGGGSMLYGCWVTANQIRTIAATTPDSLDLDGVNALCKQYAEMEYRHGQGHLQFAIDTRSQGSPISVSLFESWGMRYEALEAEILFAGRNGAVATALATTAAKHGDFWSAVRAAGIEDDWKTYEASAGPQTAHFAVDDAIAFLPYGVEDKVAAVCGQMCGELYERLRPFLD